MHNTSSNEQDQDHNDFDIINEARPPIAPLINLLTATYLHTDANDATATATTNYTALQCISILESAGLSNTNNIQPIHINFRSVTSHGATPTSVPSLAASLPVPPTKNTDDGARCSKLMSRSGLPPPSREQSFVPHILCFTVFLYFNALYTVTSVAGDDIAKVGQNALL